ncbi:MAG: hypothetical protein AMJ79_02235 [Phycisphaerae bacterium SM23_30]|nr:MAG: hypothetical protein AMJ79_02235 [Phycisphaerae bacterium SM23_30]
MKNGLKLLVAGAMLFLAAGMSSLANPSAALAHADANLTAADLLKEMPRNAEFVALIQPLDSISPKVDSLAKMIGIPIGDPAEKVNLAQLLGMTLAQEGLMVEIDGSRPLGIACSDLQQMQEMPLIYLPVQDPAAALEKLQLEKAPEVENVWLCSGVYVKPLEDYLIATENVNYLIDLTTKPKGVELSPADQNLLDRSDAALFVKLGSVMPNLREQALQALAREKDLQEHPSIAKFLALVVSRFCEFEQTGMGLSLLDEGMTFHLSGQARADTNLARLFSQHPKTDISALNKLPAGDVVEAFVIQFDPKLINAPLQAFVDAAAQDAAIGEKINPEDLKALKNNLTQLIELSYSEPAAVGMYLPKDVGSGELKVIELFSVAHAEEALQLYPQLFPLITKIAQQAGFNLPITYTKDAGTVEGISYDEMSVDLSNLPLPPEVLGLYADMFGGKAIITEQFCKLNENLYAAAMGGNCLAEALAIAQNATGALDKNSGIAKAAQHLPQQANVLFFLDVGNYLKWYLPIVQKSLKQVMQSENVPEEEMAEFEGIMTAVTGALGQARGTLGGSIAFEQGNMQLAFYLPFEAVQTTVGPVMMIIGKIIGLK